MDYLDILKKAFQITWKHKYLWVLGFLVALGSGGSNYNSNFNSQTSSPNWAGAGQWLESYLIVVILVGLILLFLYFIIWILSIIAHAGLVGAVDGIESGKEMGLGKAFGIGAHYFWRTLGINILLDLVMFLLVMIFLVPMIAGGILIAVQGEKAAAALVPALICLIPAFFLVILLLIIIGAIIGVISVYAVRYAVIQDKRAVESIRSGWRLIKARKTETMIMFLLLLLTSTLYGVVMLIPALIIGLPSVFMIIGGAAANNVALIGLGAFGVMVLVLVMAVIRGVYEVFHSAAWTLTFRQLKTTDETTLP